MFLVEGPNGRLSGQPCATDCAMFDSGQPSSYPQRRDLLIRSLPEDRFELVEVVSLRLIDGPFDGFDAAAVAARLRNVRAIWQQNIDVRGRPLGDPFKLPIS